MTVVKGQWFVMPSGRVAEVRRILDGDTPEVVIRYLDGNGAMSPGEYPMRQDFLIKHGKPVMVSSDFSPPVAAKTCKSATLSELTSPLPGEGQTQQSLSAASDAERGAPCA